MPPDLQHKRSETGSDMPLISNDQDSPFYDENDKMPEDRYGNTSADTSSFTLFDIAVDSFVNPYSDSFVDSSFNDLYGGRSNDNSYDPSEHSRGLAYYCSLGTRLVNVTQVIKVRESDYH